MRVLRTRSELDEVRAEHARRSVALVPTMGALHEGHRQLIARAGEDASAARYVSIFVNPLQFGPNEDLQAYPRPLEADIAFCDEAGVDVVFVPSEQEMYPGGPPSVTVSAGELGTVLEGRTRPGHFDGVLTVVAKLLNLVHPTAAYFGQKDAQQLALVRRMVRDLSMPTEIVGVPTVRAADGLAQSSRNAYLDPGQRSQALVLSRALNIAKASGVHGVHAVFEEAGAVLAGEPGVKLDYLELVDADTFGPVDRATTHGLLLVAAWVGGTRLIDNVTLDLGVTVER
ncbi:MAG: pantoate--beta-alanine ligase [Actinomycetota bacterium]